MSIAEETYENEFVELSRRVTSRVFFGADRHNRPVRTRDVSQESEWRGCDVMT